MHNAISNSAQSALTYAVQSALPITLTRNQLHIVTTYDVCGSHSMTGTYNYYPDVIIVYVQFQLKHPIMQLAVHDQTGRNKGFTAPSFLSVASPNTTQVAFEFWTGCNRTAPVQPSIYIMNYDGMLVVGINSPKFPFNMIANMFAPLDDEVVTFDIQLVAAPAVKINFSVVLLICAALSSLL
jgi:hypothetical protein